MTDKTVFEFSNYKDYLNRRLNENGARSGRRAQFAKALQCQSSFVSQVLHADLHLSLEQACRANDFLEHDAPHAHFFILLLQKERAGTAELRRYFLSQIEEILNNRKKIKSRVVITDELSDEQRARYYSHWDYSALHMALAVPTLRTPQALSRAFQMPLSRVETVLQFLVQAGMAQVVRGEWRIGAVQLHLGADSSFVNQHHSNWRLEALKRMDSTHAQHLHYSVVYTLSRDDYQRLRENLLKVIQANLEVIKPSPEEIVVCQTLDLLPLTT